MSAWDLSRRSRTKCVQIHPCQSTENGHHQMDQQMANEALARFLAAAAISNRLMPVQSAATSLLDSRIILSQQLGTFPQERNQSDSQSDSSAFRPDRSGQADSGRDSPASFGCSAGFSSGSLSLSETSMSSCCSYQSSPCSARASPATMAIEQRKDDLILAGRARSTVLACTKTKSDSANSDSEQPNKSSKTSFDRRARKKDQNRRAAYNYRRKKMEEQGRMMEEEARLVHKHVRLGGKIARLEGRILNFLVTSSKKILDKDGYSLWYLCPVCQVSCSAVLELRNHFRMSHFLPVTSTVQTNDGGNPGRTSGLPRNSSSSYLSDFSSSDEDSSEHIPNVHCNSQ